MTLYEECLFILGDNAKVLNNQQTKTIIETMNKLFPINSFGGIDWNKICNKKKIGSVQEIIDEIKINKLNEYDIYIIWDDATLPALKAPIALILSYIDDVTAVSFNTWIYCKDKRFIIEFYHEGEITISYK